jgi:hypothetical protein
MKTVLAIVGNELLREYIRALLERENFTPLFAAGAESGIE